MSQHFNKKKNEWYCRYRVKDCNGNIINKKKSGFKTKRDAKVFEHNVLLKFRNDLTMQFNSFCELYLEHLKATVKESTYRNRVSIINNHVLPYFMLMPVNEIKASDIDAWRINKLNNGCSANTVRSAMNALKIMLNYAVDYHDLQKNPMVKVRMQKVTHKEMHAWSEDEFKRAIAFENNRCYELAFYVLYYTGMRTGELLALSPKDILQNGDAFDIRINKNYDSTARKITSPKTWSSSRTIYIPAWLGNMIMDYMYLYSDKIKDDRIFPRHKGTLALHLSTIAEKAGVTRITPHELRHSHASVLIHQRVPVTDIAKRLGHANPSITLKTYAHWFADVDSKMVEWLEKSAPQPKDYRTSNVVQISQRKHRKVPQVFPRWFGKSIFEGALQV